jgi:hypothetical protein
MKTLRIIGDVHGQIHPEDVPGGQSQPYLEIIAGVPYSVQIGDMGDGETYHELVTDVDPRHHSFFPGNHDHYDHLPAHNLGDFGAVCWGGMEFFFVRGAESTDRGKLIRLGRELGKTLWFEQEELTEEQMQAAEEAYVRARPRIVLSHDGPTNIARLAWKNARKFGAPNPGAVFQPSRTTEFLARLLDHHPPRLWVFGHHHRDWKYQEDETLFVCVGELSYIDIDTTGQVSRQGT